MRQVFLDRGTVVIKEVCQPLLDDFSVLVSVHYSYISPGIDTAEISQAQQHLFMHGIPKKIATILATMAQPQHTPPYRTEEPFKNTVAALGSSCSGRVIAVGKKVRDFKTGDFVACAGSGFASHADIVCVPEHLTVRVNKESCLCHASLTTIGAIAIQGIRRAKLQLGESVCVLGLGLLGQLTVVAARAAGCTVFGIDIIEERIKQARDLGAHAVFHGSVQDVTREIMFATNHQGVDATLISMATPSDTLLQQAISITRKRGIVVTMGNIDSIAQRGYAQCKEVDILVSCLYGPGYHDYEYEQRGQDYPYAYVRWTENRNMSAFIDLLEQGHIDLSGFFATEYNLEKVAAAYEEIIQKKIVGAVLRYGPRQDGFLTQSAPANDHVTSLAPYIPARRDSIMSVGFLGITNTTQRFLMPLLAKIPTISIDAIVDQDITKSLTAAKYCGATRIYSSSADLLMDDSIKLIVIAAQKNQIPDALEALARGKAVFIDQPVVSEQCDLDDLKLFLRDNPHAPCCLNYNRSHAPYIKKIKQALAQCTSPIMIHYRINASVKHIELFNSKTTQGSIIGNAYHIIDTLLYLMDSKPISVSVESLQAAKDVIFPTENFSVQIKFMHGSIGSILYTTIGSHRQERERLELFFDGKAIVMQDYERLFGYGLPASFAANTANPDAGDERLFSTFVERLREPQYTPPVPIEHMLQVIETTVLIDKLVCDGGGSKEYTR